LPTSTKDILGLAH